MRFLHTSDWHLGQTLHGFERVHEHQCFLDWLLQTLVAERVDALLIAGDVYDNANPSAASQKQLYRFLRQAKSAVPHLNIVIIAGNHDSPGRLEAPGPLLEEHEVSLVGNVLRSTGAPLRISRPVIVTTFDEFAFHGRTVIAACALIRPPAPADRRFAEAGSRDSVATTTGSAFGVLRLNESTGGGDSFCDAPRANTCSSAAVPPADDVGVPPDVIATYSVPSTE